MTQVSSSPLCLVAVSMVKNEADIIEAFVRHTAAWVDLHLVFDHASTDGTREILGALQREGLPLQVFTDDFIGKNQQARTQALIHEAIHRFNADWVLPLDADEILVGPDRPALELGLQKSGASQPVAIPMLNYFFTSEDDPTEANVVRRLCHCEKRFSPTPKAFVPRVLGLDPDVHIVPGNHGLTRGDTPIATPPLPDGFHLAHLSLRSPQQLALRIVQAELQRLSGGEATRGIDTHYRVGFQLLREDPARFFATQQVKPSRLRPAPIPYRGDALRYSRTNNEWHRLTQSLLPFLERLATDHGRLIDGDPPPPSEPLGSFREIQPLPHQWLELPPFTGFEPVANWGAAEGPLPEATFPQFHWGFGPKTVLRITAPAATQAHLRAEVFTYCANQSIVARLNDQPIGEYAFQAAHQIEKLDFTLPLQPGDNVLEFSYREIFVTDYDPRQMAVIFFSLRILTSEPTA